MKLPVQDLNILRKHAEGKKSSSSEPTTLIRYLVSSSKHRSFSVLTRFLPPDCKDWWQTENLQVSWEETNVRCPPTGSLKASEVHFSIPFVTFATFNCGEELAKESWYCYSRPVPNVRYAQSHSIPAYSINSDIILFHPIPSQNVSPSALCMYVITPTHSPQTSNFPKSTAAPSSSADLIVLPVLWILVYTVPNSTSFSAFTKTSPPTFPLSAPSPASTTWNSLRPGFERQRDRAPAKFGAMERRGGEKEGKRVKRKGGEGTYLQPSPRLS